MCGHTAKAHGKPCNSFYICCCGVAFMPRRNMLVNSFIPSNSKWELWFVNPSDDDVKAMKNPESIYIYIYMVVWSYFPRAGSRKLRRRKQKKKTKDRVLVVLMHSRWRPYRSIKIQRHSVRNGDDDRNLEALPQLCNL